jgi:hypothetical protein
MRTGSSRTSNPGGGGRDDEEPVSRALRERCGPDLAESDMMSGRSHWSYRYCYRRCFACGVDDVDDDEQCCSCFPTVCTSW